MIESRNFTPATRCDCGAPLRDAGSNGMRWRECSRLCSLNRRHSVSKNVELARKAKNAIRLAANYAVPAATDAETARQIEEGVELVDRLAEIVVQEVAHVNQEQDRAEHLIRRLKAWADAVETGKGEIPSLDRPAIATALRDAAADLVLAADQNARLLALAERWESDADCTACPELTRYIAGELETEVRGLSARRYAPHPMTSAPDWTTEAEARGWYAAMEWVEATRPHLHAVRDAYGGDPKDPAWDTPEGIAGIIEELSCQARALAARLALVEMEARL
jgi:hypothetical protein